VLPSSAALAKSATMQSNREGDGCLRFREKVKIYRAPSWSWAAFDGPVHFGDCVNDNPQSATNHWDPECSILEAPVTCSNTVDPCGQVSSGYFTISGRLKRAICQSCHGRIHYYDYDVSVLLNWFDWAASQNPLDCTGIFDVRELPQGKQVWCLQVTKLLLLAWYWYESFVKRKRLNVLENVSYAVLAQKDTVIGSKVARRKQLLLFDICTGCVISSQ
jgi:hypothetical protein